jgi:uncharacterized protein HemX
MDTGIAVLIIGGMALACFLGSLYFHLQGQINKNTITLSRLENGVVSKPDLKEHIERDNEWLTGMSDQFKEIQRTTQDLIARQESLEKEQEEVKRIRDQYQRGG